jgi:glucokinase
MILAGDIGGTHTRLAFFEVGNGQLRPRREETYPSQEHKGLDEIVAAFLGNESAHVTAACFGVAGPVVNGRVAASNLPWVVDASELSRVLKIKDVSVINDLVAHAYGLDQLAASDLLELNAGVEAPGNAALIAPGTGLGEAGLYADESGRHPFASEGGHSDFAPRNELESELLKYLMAKFDRVSYERVLSGPGIENIYDFLRDSGRELEPDWLREQHAAAEDRSQLISRLALEGKADICVGTMDIFTEALGAEAGNVALKFMATGGLFIGGGIAPRILPVLKKPIFLQAFLAKGRMQGLLKAVRVSVVLNDKTGLIGAARCAVLNSNTRTVAV